MTLAIGGWNEGSEKYSEMAADPVSRRTFARSALSFIRRHKFDGLDLDWEYPGKRGGKPEDRENFILLIKDLYKVDISHIMSIITQELCLRCSDRLASCSQRPLEPPRGPLMLPMTWRGCTNTWTMFTVS